MPFLLVIDGMWLVVGPEELREYICFIAQEDCPLQTNHLHTYIYIYTYSFVCWSQYFLSILYYSLLCSVSNSCLRCRISVFMAGYLFSYMLIGCQPLLQLYLLAFPFWKNYLVEVNQSMLAWLLLLFTCFSNSFDCLKTVGTIWTDLVPLTHHTILLRT